MMFPHTILTKVGEKYTSGSSGCIWKVLYIGNRRTFMVGSDGREISAGNETFHTLYKRHYDTVSRWVVFYKNGGGELAISDKTYTSKAEAEKWFGKIFDVIAYREIKLTEQTAKIK